MSNQVKAIIFDCFGVLYNDATHDFLQRHDETLGSKPPEYFAGLNRKIDTGQISEKEFYAELSAVTAIPPERIKAEFDDTSGLDFGVVELIERLKPHYKIGMLTNAEKGFLQQFLDNQNVGRLFDVVLASSEIGFVKPQKQIFDEILKRLGVGAEETIFVDDRESNTRAATALGIDSILFLNAAQTRSELERRLK